MARTGLLSMELKSEDTLPIDNGQGQSKGGKEGGKFQRLAVQRQNVRY